MTIYYSELIKQILTKNNFELGDSHFLEIHGTAMGTRMAPSYANIFMGKLEKELLAHSRKKPTVWWRYIDDVFALWTHGEESLNNFIGEINQAHPTIKFTAEWSKESVSFLDTTVKLEDGQLVTDLFVKPTDTHRYLAANSCHPRHCKEAIPYSQALRMRRICSSDESFNRRTTELKEHLVCRGYNSSLVQQQLERTRHLRQKDALTPRAKTTQNRRTPLVVSYHPNLPHLTAITQQNLPILHASQHRKKPYLSLPSWLTVDPRTSGISWSVRN